MDNEELTRTFSGQPDPGGNPKFGESLMPADCAKIINKRYSITTRRQLGKDKLAEMIQTMMTAGGFDCRSNTLSTKQLT